MSDRVRDSELYSRACREVDRAAIAAISSRAAEADSIHMVFLFSFCRKQGTRASNTISIWRLTHTHTHIVVCANTGVCTVECECVCTVGCM